jgi:hypothetical protein
MPKSGRRAAVRSAARVAAVESNPFFSMPILVLVFALIALIYGAVRAFEALALRFGNDVAIGVAALVLALIAVAIAGFVRRRREVAANLHEGDWTHGFGGDWGQVRLAADKRLCDLRVGAARGSYIFADLQRVQAQREPDGWRVALHVADRAHPVWLLPVKSEREAKRWTRIFSLAIAQRL